MSSTTPVYDWFTTIMEIVGDASLCFDADTFYSIFCMKYPLMYKNQGYFMRAARKVVTTNYNANVISIEHKYDTKGGIRYYF